MSKLFDGAARGDLGEVKRLVANGADVNDANEWGSTPLHWAAESGHAAIVDFLKQPKAARPKTGDRRGAILALLAEDGTMRQRLGIKADLEVAPEFDVERLIRYAIKRQELTDPTLEAYVEAGIEFHMQAANMLSAEVEDGNPMRP